MKEMIVFLSNHYVLSTLWILLLCLLITSIIRDFFSKSKAISCLDTISLINKENALVVDIRPQDYYRKGHITAALGMQAKALSQTGFTALKKHKLRPIVFVCEDGRDSANLVNETITAGLTRAYFLKEGMMGWNDANLPLVTGN
jgi:rhodanese-related sulfurtransferase